MTLSKKFFSVFACVLSASAFFACSESKLEGSPTDVSGSNVSSSSASGVGTCNALNVNDIKFVAAENAYYRCDGLNWVAMSSSSIADNSSSSVVLSSSSVASSSSLLSSSSNTSGGNVFSTLDDLPNCSASRENQLVVVLTTNTPYICTDGRWVVYGTSSSSSSISLSSSAIVSSSSNSLSSSSNLVSSSSNNSSSSSLTPSLSSSSTPIEDFSSSSVECGDDDKLWKSEGGKYYECIDGEWVEGISSSSEVSSSSSLAQTEDPGIKPDGYYSNGENCPAGLTCKYAATTKYLNSSKTYGEILDTRDGQVYKTIEICDKNDENCQIWMAQNLNYDPGDVSSMGDYAWSGCYGDGGYDYSRDRNLTNEEIVANCSKYGRLYTWEVAVDKAGCGFGNYCNNSYEGTQGVCPSGWHLPTKEDWRKLVYNAEVELKTVDDWYSSSNKGTNASGFSALPAGYRNRNSNRDFDFVGNYAYFWSASEDIGYYAYGLRLYYRNDLADLGPYDKDYGFSVRCLKDSPDQGGEGSSPSVTPDPDPGANSSASEEDVAVVQPDGYYSENCPAGRTCKYATTTDYLNSSKTYGEILDTRDGQVYKTIEICDDKNENCQTWMAQNLNYAPDPEKVSCMGDYAWSGCYGEGLEGFTEEQVAANCSKYGRLYTWEVAMDKAGCGYGTDCNNSYEGTQGVCLEGWHLPTNTDWQTLFTNVGGTNTPGKLLKANTSLWYENTGTDSFGFAVLPAGYRSYDGGFGNEGINADFWSSTEYDDSAYYWYFYYYYDDVDYYWNIKYGAYSVRCLRDSP